MERDTEFGRRWRELSVGFALFIIHLYELHPFYHILSVISYSVSIGWELLISFCICHLQSHINPTPWRYSQQRTSGNFNCQFVLSMNLSTHTSFCVFIYTIIFHDVFTFTSFFFPGFIFQVFIDFPFTMTMFNRVDDHVYVFTDSPNRSIRQTTGSSLSAPFEGFSQNQTSANMVPELQRHQLLQKQALEQGAHGPNLYQFSMQPNTYPSNLRPHEQVQVLILVSFLNRSKNLILIVHFVDCLAKHSCTRLKR